MPSPGDPGETIWAPSCGADQQIAIFKRDVELLGPAQSGSLRWFISTNSVPGWYGLKTFDVYANGHKFFHWAYPAPVNNVTFTPAMLKTLRNGRNAFEVRATRFALPKGSTKCNAGAKPAIGLNGTFNFAFVTDLRVGVSAEKVSVRHGTSLVVKQFVKNEGPDRALDGELAVYYGGQGEATVLIVDGGFCEKESKTQFHCRFKELDPKEQLAVYARVEYKPTPDYPKWDHISGSVQFTARSATPESNMANDSYSNVFILCQDGSTLPECKT